LFNAQISNISSFTEMSTCKLEKGDTMDRRVNIWDLKPVCPNEGFEGETLPTMILVATQWRAQQGDPFKVFAS
jgi:hypothetical protein